jgi:hypothetical protein
MTDSTGDVRPAKPGRMAPLWILVVCILVGVAGGFLGGFLASGLHPGPQGAAGPAGVTGPAGVAGPAGSAAKVEGLGVCYSADTQYSGGVTWVDSLTLSSPSKHADGTTYCAYGDYVAVQPQR